MIPTKSQVTTEGNLSGTRVAMTIRAEDMAHIMGVVTDLYSNPMLAVLREYSTNALDAHKDAGQTSPIEVDLPSRFNNSLVIRDHGTGLSVTDLTETYGMFGRSTKRDSNEFNGCLGLGSKSALTYGSTFTVSSVKDGVRSEVVVYRDESGLGQLDIVDTRATDEANGTTVTIPTKNGDSFTTLAEDFFRVWDEGTVVVNGVAPKHISDLEDFTLIDGSYIRSSEQGRYSGYGSNSHVHIVMGGVTYTREIATPHEFSRALTAYMFVPLGSVEFVPSREDLQWGGATQAYVEKAWKDLGAAYAAHIAKSLNNASTITEAAAAYLKLVMVLNSNNNNLLWRGIKMEQIISWDHPNGDDDGRRWVRGRSRGWNSPKIGVAESTGSIRLDTAYRSDVAFLTGRKSKSSLSSVDKHRLTNYLVSEGLAYETIFFNGDSTLPILGGVNFLDWNDVLAATKADPIPKGAPKPKGEWDYYQPTATYPGYSSTFGPLPTGVKVLFIAPAEMNERWNSYQPSNVAAALPDKTVLVMVAKNRQEKFKRENPKAVHLTKHITAERDRVSASLTDLDKEAYRSSSHRGYYTALAGQTKDSRIDAIYGRMDSVSKRVNPINKLMSATRRGTLDVGSGSDYIKSTYPLVKVDHLAHSIIYINSIHQEGTK